MENEKNIFNGPLIHQVHVFCLFVLFRFIFIESLVVFDLIFVFKTNQLISLTGTLCALEEKERQSIL